MDGIPSGAEDWSARKPWPGHGLADVNADCSALAKHPLGAVSHVVSHDYLLTWLAPLAAPPGSWTTASPPRPARAGVRRAGDCPRDLPPEPFAPPAYEEVGPRSGRRVPMRRRPGRGG